MKSIKFTNGIIVKEEAVELNLQVKLQNQLFKKYSKEKEYLKNIERKVKQAHSCTVRLISRGCAGVCIVLKWLIFAKTGDCACGRKRKDVQNARPFSFSPSGLSPARFANGKTK